MGKTTGPRRLLALLLVSMGPASVTSFVQPTHSRWAQPRPSERPRAPLQAATADDLLAQAAALRKEADEAQKEVEQEKQDR